MGQSEGRRRCLGASSLGFKLHLITWGATVVSSQGTVGLRKPLEGVSASFLPLLVYLEEGCLSRSLVHCVCAYGSQRTTVDVIAQVPSTSLSPFSLCCLSLA